MHVANTVECECLMYQLFMILLMMTHCDIMCSIIAGLAYIFRNGTRTEIGCAQRVADLVAEAYHISLCDTRCVGPGVIFDELGIPFVRMNRCDMTRHLSANSRGKHLMCAEPMVGLCPYPLIRTLLHTFKVGDVIKYVCYGNVHYPHVGEKQYRLLNRNEKHDTETHE